MKIPDLQLPLRERPRLPDEDAQNVLVAQSFRVKQRLGRSILDSGNELPVLEIGILARGVDSGLVGC